VICYAIEGVKIVRLQEESHTQAPQLAELRTSGCQATEKAFCPRGIEKPLMARPKSPIIGAW
jgi:hypothetical protein